MASLSFAGTIEVSGNTGYIDIEIGGSDTVELTGAEGGISVTNNTTYVKTATVVNNPDGVYIELEGSTPEDTQETISVTDGTTTLYITITAVASDPGGGGSSTIYKMELEDDSLTFSAKGNTSDSRSVGYKIYSSGNGGGTWIECADPSGVTVSGGNAGYVTVSADNQNLGGWHGHIIVTRTNTNYTNDSIDGTDSVSVQSNTWTGASAEIYITITKVEYNYKLQIDNYPTPSTYNSTITTNDFKVYKYKNSTLNSTYQKESNTDYAGSCDWTPSLPYTGSNTNGESKSFQASLTGYDPDLVTIEFPAKAEDPYITLDGESSYSETLNRVGDGEGEGAVTLLTVATNLLSWTVNASTNASTVSSYGIRVEKSGSSEVSISGTSTYGGQSGSSITGIWTVGNSSTYATISITLTYTQGQEPTYTWNMVLTPSSISFDYSDYTDKTVYFDIYRDSEPFDVDSVEVSPGAYSNYFTITVNNQSLGNHHGYATIQRLPGTSTLNTTASFDCQGAGGASAELAISIGEAPSPSYQWVYDSVSFTDYSVEVPVGTNSHTVGSISGSYTIQKQQSLDGGNTWTDIVGVTDSSTFSDGALTTSFTRTRSQGDYSGSKSASVTVTHPAINSQHTFSGDVNVSITFAEPPDITHVYGIRIASPSHNSTVYYSSSGHSLYQPLASSDFTIYLSTDGVEDTNINIVNNCSFYYTEIGGSQNDGLPPKNSSTDDINYEIFVYWNSDHNVYESITVTYEGAPNEYPKYQYVGRNVVFYDDTQTSSSTCWWYTSTTLSGGTYTKVYQSKASASADWIDESSTNEYRFYGGHVDSTVSLSPAASPGNSTTVSATATDDGITLSGNVTLYAIYEEPQQQDTYSIEITSSSINLTSQDSYAAQTFYAVTKTNSSYANWGNLALSSSDIENSSSRLSITIGTYNTANHGYLITVNKKSTYSPTNNATAKFKLSGNGVSSSTVTVTFTVQSAPSTYSIAFDEDNPTTIEYSKSAILFFTKTPSNASASYSVLSGSEHINVYKYSSYLRVYNYNSSYQNQTATIKITNDSDTTKTDTATITLYPKSFYIKIVYWYDDCHSYEGRGEGDITVYGAPGEHFTLTLSNAQVEKDNQGNTIFEYGFQSGGSWPDYTYSTSYSGTVGSNGSTVVHVYEYKCNENTTDDGYAEVTAVGGNSSRTGYCTIRRIYYAPSWSIEPSKTQFTYEGGSVSFTLRISGYDSTTFKVDSIIDTAGMLSGLSLDSVYTYSTSATVLSNPSISSRECKITFKNTDENEGGSTTIILKQSGRNTVNSLSISPATLTFSPTNLSSQEVTVISSDFSWSIGSYEMHDPEGETPSSGTWWECTPTSGISGDKITVTTTQTSPYSEKKTRSAVITINGGNGASTLLTIYQTGDERKMEITGTLPAPSSGIMDSSNFLGNVESWSYRYNDSSHMGELTLNVYAEPNIGELSSISIFNILSKFIGWDISCLEDPAPSWLSISPVELLLRNEATTPVSVTAEPWTTEVDASCYLKSRSTMYILTSTIKSN